MDWAGATTFRDGQTLFERGVVQEAEVHPPIIRGSLSWGNRTIRTSAKILPDGACENMCPCRDSTERGIVCSHVIALGLALIKRASDPDRERKMREEARRAARLSQVNEALYLKRAPPGTPGAVPGELRMALDKGWQDRSKSGMIPILCGIHMQNRTWPIDQIPAHTVVALSKSDESILFVLEDISEGPAKSRLEVHTADFLNLLELHVAKPLYEAGSAETITVNAAKMTSVLRMDMDRENGELILIAHTELPFMKAGEFPFYVTAGRAGWVYGARHFWPLSNILPDPLRSIYDQPAIITRDAVLRFLQKELPLLAQHIQVESELSLDLFTIEPERPSYRLAIRGSPASLAAVLYAEYGGTAIVAGKTDPRGHFAHPDPADLLRYTVRNPEHEAAALKRLEFYGFKGEVGDELAPIVGCREVLNFLGSSLPAIRRLGWKADLEGKISPFMDTVEFVTPVVHVSDHADGEWFEVNFDFDDGHGGSLSSADIQRALRKGDAYFEVGDRTLLLDAGAIQSMMDVFSDCASGEGSRPGSFRMNRIYASYVKSSLDALDGIDVEATPAWRSVAEQQNRTLTLQPVTLSEPLNSILRSYQKEGVNWLRFLEAGALCGILADEMGLGKTLQTLTWLQLERHHPQARGRPSLIVCPTSLVENWAEEAAKFVPSMKVLTITGSDRHEKWARVDQADLVITSYALMRRDIEQYVAKEFAVVALDEAQHIKNRSTQNSMAAKRLRAFNRLVLTGTPVENSVSDLWSIMDFLMQDYLGSHEVFRQHYEIPISQGGPEGEAAQVKLRRKLHPFLLRRLKKDVAKDLPPKIERVASCSLTTDQKRVYLELLESSRRQIGDMVGQKGFSQCRMEILKMLLRLRQTCCHLDLLKLPGLESKMPSGKMELFFELMDEAMDAGHRVLVFSQFVSMLTILRQELESRQIAYCYLDGSTKDRLKIVHEFNSNRSIPLFLISLKAGGTGLNLTGADMVVHFDPWWNPAVENQATDRAYRIGQKRTVYSVKLITRDTIEERVLAMQKRKKAVIDATLESDEQVMSALNWEDIQELLAE
jgi:superfamily II DNA or RNA helicase